MATATHPHHTTDRIVPRGHFTWAEALHSSGYEHVLDIPEHVREGVVRHAHALEAVRRLVNRTRRRHGRRPTGIHILSWVRSPAHNAAVGGARLSQHLNGDGTDIALQEIDRLCPWPGGRHDFDAILDHVFARGGVGLYPRGNRHCDSRGWRARWTSF